MIQIAKEVIQKESESIKRLPEFIDNQFVDCIELILGSKGRVIITGIGKSGIIAEKIVATLNSTGTPAIFMHAADAIHGDLGIIRKNDVVVCLSKSGNTPEIKVLVPFIKKTGNKLVAFISNTDSFLARQADIVIKTTVEKEACPHNLAPTSSTTAQLVMGDALAVTLLDIKKFSDNDFAKYHPGGALGRRLYLRVEDLYILNDVPKVFTEDKLKDVIVEISAKRLGATAVLDENNNLKGIITDGDLRRMLEKTNTLDNITAREIMNINPKTVSPEEYAINAFEIMRKKNITSLIVVKDHKYLGIIHLHDMLKEGFV
ncbi:MAG: KpsF/GutQ family sugar-phosphate isomerase [Bacteroidales bacterium]|nr:KpsF/GutQ family sugar-phosphate isomerase [Bacteroidales bacterium]